jgi:parvulin-like peptidyl-prolyl isomerase
VSADNEDRMNRRLAEDNYTTTRVKCAGFASLLAWCCLLSACHRQPSATPPSDTPRADVLATVGGQAILLADFQAELQRRAHRPARAGAKEELLEELVNSEAVYLRARQAGFEQRPDIARQIKLFIVQRFIEEQQHVESRLASPTQDEIGQYYLDQAARFATPEKVRFAVIQFAYSAKAANEKKEEMLTRATAVLVEASSSNATELTFSALAQRHSEDQATRYQGGDAGWLSRNESSRWPSAVIDAAFALKKEGGLAPVIITSNGCYLVKLLERKEAGHKPLAEVAEAIRYELAVKARHRAQDEFYNTAKADLAIEINHALLNSLPAPSSPPISTPPVLPGS